MKPIPTRFIQYTLYTILGVMPLQLTATEEALHGQEGRTQPAPHQRATTQADKTPLRLTSDQLDSVNAGQGSSNEWIAPIAIGASSGGDVEAQPYQWEW